MRLRIRRAEAFAGSSNHGSRISLARLLICLAWTASFGSIPAVSAADSVATCLSQEGEISEGTGFRFLERQLEGQPVANQLRGRDSRWQLQVVGQLPSGKSFDATHRLTYQVQPATVARVDAIGVIEPLANGTATVEALWKGAVVASAPLEVVGFDSLQPIDFGQQVVPLFTKFGCNGGGCHGKLSGQNGFKLSLLGFDAGEDYEHLVKEGRGRRLFPSAPDRSLLLMKAVNASPHGGGQRMDVDSHEYRLMRRWIEQAMPRGSANPPQLVAIEVYPNALKMLRKGSQQLSVLARYSDGMIEDITQTAQYDSNNLDMAEVDPKGRVRTHELAGDVAIMARYQGKVGVFRASIPLSDQPPSYPEATSPIDLAVFAKLKSLGIPAAAPCDDSTFLRRVTLDIAGRLPTVAETQAFLADSDSQKRSRWIDQLLASGDYADYFASKWSAILRNRRAGVETQFGSYAFHEWIRQSLYENIPYDRWVRQLMTASGAVEANPAVVWWREVNNTESRVEDAAQLFLGQRIQCARCHHHPFEKWSQDDYYQLSAFFSTVERKEGRLPQEPMFVSRVGKAEARHPKTGKPLNAAGLEATAIDLDPTIDPRTALADWMVAPSNPFFAKSLANRYWKHFFGRGLVDPEDDMRATNPPTNPELLDALAQGLVDSGYDLKQLVRSICNSQVYQFSAQAEGEVLKDTTSHARFYPRRMTAEVLLDAIDVVCQTRTGFDGMPAGTRAVSLPDTQFNSYFLTVFGRPESSTACECERAQGANLAQSLHLLNSKDIQAKLSADQGLAAVMAADTTRSNDQKINELYLRAFSRQPNPQEIETALNYLEKKKDKPKEALEDLIWAILNSKEFLFNH